MQHNRILNASSGVIPIKRTSNLNDELMRCSESRTNSPILMFFQLVHHNRGLIRSTSPDVTTVFDAEMDDTFVETKSNFRKRNFLEGIKITIL